ncbi:MAG TPA: hypothetical protein VI461_09775 [Chitinophagaceae bacterium]|nr:hypothetical protein [Chitinophagaceae bacterium]
MKRKQWIIGSIVGAIIVFAWQGLSWMVIGVHDNHMKYTPAQDEILTLLKSKITEEGLYSMPSGATKKEAQEMVEKNEGQPWASIIYHKEYHMDMTMRMIRAFLVDLFLVVSLIYILTRGGVVPIARRVFSGSVALGLAFFLAGEYMGHVWFDLPWHMITGNLIDHVVSWSLCGIWLGWWMNKK